MNMSERPHSLIYTDWTVIEPHFDPTLLHARETVFTIGNGYLGTRGSFEEGHPQAMAATLIHGVYDHVPVVYTELVNCPDWLPLVITIEGDRFRLDQGEVLSYERSLDLQHGRLSRSVRWRSPAGKTIDLHFERFASFADQHVLALRCQITPVDFEGSIEVQASINGYPENQGFNHWESIGQGATRHGVWLRVRTRTSRIELAMASGMNLSGAEGSPQTANVPGYPTLLTSFFASPDQTVTIENVITVYTSRDVEAPTQAAQTKLADLPSYADLRSQHEDAWKQAWENSDILIEGDVKSQLAVRYNIFQLLISAAKHDDQVSIPAKTLSGFGYRGHVFWDTEIFILPFFTYTQPALARNLLTYRYHTLEGARRKAAHYGFKGAMYSWESADTGDEVTPRWALPNDPYAEDIRIWCRDREIHISADIAYAAWNYWQATGDDDWMRDYGAEIILDTAVFWMSRVEWSNRHERYEIREVIGADEYHEHDVNNSVFTNRLAQWHLEKAIAVYDWLKQHHPQRLSDLEKKLKITPERRSRWQDIAKNLWILDSPSGLIEQFEGFFDLKDINLNDYEPRTKSIQALIGIEEGNRRQVLKQPDVLMLLYLMRQSQEFPYSPAAVEKNWDYYAPRTDITYGSSLGPAIHSILASDLGKSVEAYDRFMQAALVDLEDTRGNASEGIHGASAGGIWQVVVFGFGGIQLGDRHPVANPHLPPGWSRLKFRLHWRGKWHDFDLKPNPTQHLPAPMTPPPPSSPRLPIRGVIFDLDGVLTDTAEYHYRSWQRLADEEELPFDRDANEALRGVSRRESLMLIVGDRTYSEAQLHEMMERKNGYYVELIQTVSPHDLLPGALTLLEELRQAGIKTAIGSASKNARPVVEKLGIADQVDAIADGYSVEHPKPAPDLFLFAAQELGLDPGECVVFEDAAAGVEAALAAGMWAVGLGPEERVGAAHVVLPSLADMHWSAVQERVQQASHQECANS
ncbi:beta-phosphoglucomutase [Myxacorys almedinensis]|uniref:Beta-phosphoglucomutase n=1 Tax=Myxacorys almedinensis A TaxID=2690445 RepID=A0A8J7Z5Q0_9CYAN|nr:beta-phosphoglucomutase [Myxacorys almedinensis]NDJ18646.1 beta-phosphoglucomutase [Myxacorys almedinensis A]